MLTRSLFFVLLLGISGLVFAQESSDSVCNELLSLEADWNKQAPIKVDEATELIQFRVNCANKTVNYVKRLLFDESLFADGWATRKQRQHTQRKRNKENRRDMAELEAALSQPASGA